MPTFSSESNTAIKIFLENLDCHSGFSRYTARDLWPMRRLDINLLLALTDPMHVHHELSHQWFAKRAQKGWATCPLTENGFVRIASHPKYPNRPGDVRAVCSILGQICKSPGHHFWTEDLSILDILESGTIITHAQITDVYLLGLAFLKKGKLATLDQRIPVNAVRGGRQALELLIGL